MDIRLDTIALPSSEAGTEAAEKPRLDMCTLGAALQDELLDFPGCEYTGHVTKKGCKIYRSVRVKKDGTERVSFFTINKNPTKRFISKKWLLKNNMSFLPATRKQNDSTVHAADSRRDG